ncbi:MAG: TolC family protein [Gammaproteobacteria bacterium]|nr:TolC family protein [Gammaproteobacteria bacterium]
MKKLKVLGVVCCLYFSNGNVFAQQSSELLQELTVHDAFQSALSLSPEVKSAQDRIQALVYRRQAADSITAQPATLEGGYRSDSLHNNQGLREVTLGVSAPVWNWSERQFTQNVRDAEIQEAKVQLEQTRLDIADQVRQLVWDLEAAQAEVELAKIRVSSMQVLAANINKLVKAGELPEADSMQARVLIAEGEIDLGRAVSVLEVSKANYFKTIGLTVKSEERFLPENKSIPESVDLESHPTIKLSQAKLGLIQAQKKLTGTQSRPNTEVGIALISDRAAFSGGQEKSFVLTTRIPLGSSSEHKSRVLDIEAIVTAANMQLVNTQRTLAYRSKVAKDELELFSRLRLASVAQANLSQKLYELNRKAFELGETDFASLIRLERAAAEANKLSRKASIQYAKKVSDYRQVMGLLP